MKLLPAVRMPSGPAKATLPKVTMPTMGKGPKLGTAPEPGDVPMGLGGPKSPSIAHGAGVRPRMRLRKLSIAGKSAFGSTAPAAFGDPAGAAGPMAAFSGGGGDAGPGDSGG